MKNLYSCHSPRVLTNKSGKKIFVGCGKCPACRAKRRSQVVQLMNDYDRVYRFCDFFTLTYNEDSVPFHRFDDGETVNVLSRQDAQKFIKRLRRNIDYYDTRFESDRVQSISYFICGEYGPTTLRPHYHGVIYHNSSYLHRNISSIVRKVWKFGFSDCSSRESSAAYDYVAKYVNKCCKFLDDDRFLPEDRRLYEPFILHSFGLYKKSLEFFKEGFEEEIKYPSGKRLCQVDGRSSVTRLGNNLENYLFPKCREFDLLDHDELVQRYSISFRQSCCEYLDSQCIDEHDDFRLAQTVYDRCKRDYYISQKFKVNCLDFGLSPDVYLSRIIEYYKLKDKNNLIDFYRLLEQKSKDVQEVNFDLLYVDTFNYQELKKDQNFISFRNESYEIQRKQMVTKELNNRFYSKFKY